MILNRRKTIEKRTRYWQDRMGLINWDVIIVFGRVPDDNDEGNFGGIAYMDSNPQYKMATLTYSKGHLDQIDDGVIVHELIHCIMSPLMVSSLSTAKDRQNMIDYYHEQVTSEIERIILRLMK